MNTKFIAFAVRSVVAPNVKSDFLKDFIFNVLFFTFLAGEVSRGLSDWFESNGIYLHRYVHYVLSALFGGPWWAWSIVLILVLIIFNFSGTFKRLGILSIGDKKPKDLITLEDAASTFHENCELPDDLLQYFPSPERQDTLDELFHERDNPNEKPDKKLDWKVESILNLLTMFFKKGSLALYGSHYPAKNIKKIPSRDIKFLAKDFSYIYYLNANGKKSIRYNNLLCSQKELLEFIVKEKKPGRLSLDSLKLMISPNGYTNLFVHGKRGKI